MKRILLTLVIGMPLSALSAINPLTPEQVLQHIQHEGAKSYLQGLATAHSRAVVQSEWETIMEQVSSGNADWLKVVPLIAADTDAGFSEDLGTALAQAIPKNVGGVMAVINDHLSPVSIRSVCSMPLYVESIPEQNSYFVKAVQALYKDDTPQAKDCLKQLINTVGWAGPFRMVD